jgi:hypothetical protein
VSRKPKHPAELWERYSHAAGAGIFSRPVRFLVLLNGDMIALMEELSGGSWCIFATERANGKITKSPVYRMRSVAEVMFREIADEITERDKDTLAARATAVPYEQATPEEKRHIANAALEYMRLKCADEDAFEGSLALARKITPQEVESYIRESLDARTRQQAQEVEAE